MANIKTEGEIIKVKGSKFMYAWSVLFNFGGIGACLFILHYGLQFESKYSLRYIGGGLSLLPFFIYTTLWYLPSYKPGKILFTIVMGEDGKIVTKKRNVSIKDIREIDYVYNQINLMNDIVIKTYNHKKVKIRTYNLLDDDDFFRCIDNYVYPFMTEEAKMNWDHKYKFLKEEGFERENQKIN
ncbi:DUF5381 family protein [Bacillus sp. FJAT-47783]|uniref:DUF5381 family protein n=1 Tax=Bacillus sp. FJAT-47783 TaxID=2922712 RepID=UPI001FAC298F|nr:DUF5381 family protein [Bacillus sp. FJAT-47783]